MTPSGPAGGEGELREALGGIKRLVLQEAKWEAVDEPATALAPAPREGGEARERAKDLVMDWIMSQSPLALRNVATSELNDLIDRLAAALAPTAAGAEITPEQARYVVESDAALCIDRMLRRMDEQDKAAFNFCIRQAARPVPAATGAEWIPATRTEFLDLIRADVQAAPRVTPTVDTLKHCSVCYFKPFVPCSYCGHPGERPPAPLGTPPGGEVVARLRDELLVWVDSRIEAEVTHRPTENRYKAMLAETWAQVRNRLELIPDAPVASPGRAGEERGDGA